MRRLLERATLPGRSVLMTCSSHEDRCKGLLSASPLIAFESLLFHYDDENHRREENHKWMLRTLSNESQVCELDFSEQSTVESFRSNMPRMADVLSRNASAPIVVDASVFTKKHLLMLLRWLDDAGAWDRVWVVYCEPEDYDVSEFVPLSFGVASVQETPGFTACANLSRPVHLVLFLGYEGDRASAVFEHVQPMRTTLVVPYPAYKPSWEGRTERFNADLIRLLGDVVVEKVDAIDPDATESALDRILGNRNVRSNEARLVCPLGTKPQAIGIYQYLRKCVDPPAVIYAGALRHNHQFFSHGFGNCWLLKSGDAPTHDD